jgi:hypothetical protein
VLRRLVDATLGNPLFALELGRPMAERGPPALGEDFPIPDGLEEILGARVARLGAPVRRLLLAVALDGELRSAQLEALADPGAVDDAFDAGVIVADGDRVRASHPLLAAAAKKHARPRDRRALHGELARVASDADEGEQPLGRRSALLRQARA